MKNLFNKVIMLCLFCSFAFAETVETRVGNGGDLAPGEAISVSELSEMVERVRLQLALHFNYIDTHYWGDQAQVYSGLFARDMNDVNAFQNSILYKTYFVAIHEESQGPCFDEQNSPKDGSTSGPTPRTAVCISTFNLSKKLQRQGAEAHLAALVAHEYAHLAGADEAQAQKVQKDVLRRFANSSYDAALNYSRFVDMSSSGAKYSIANIAQAETWEMACEAAIHYSDELQPLFTEVVLDLYSIASRPIRSATDTLRIQVENIVIGTCLQANSAKGQGYSNMYKGPYGRVFKNGPEVSVTVFRDTVLSFWPKEVVDANLTVTQITDRASLKSALDQIKYWHNEIHRVTFDNLANVRRNQ